MSNIIESILKWSEVWALLIPLLVLTFRHKQPNWLKPVIVYLWLALFLNLFADIIALFKTSFNFPVWLQSNNFIYNIHSIVRLSCFSYFFITLNQPYFRTLKKILALVSLLFVIIDFTFFDNFFYQQHLSGNLLTAEAYLLLIYCMLYYLSELRSEDDVISTSPAFWIVTGLSLYVVTNFFVFLFYVPMIEQDIHLTVNIWDVHNIAYIILCLFIAKAFYATDRD
jgi:hypothetical protein